MLALMLALQADPVTPTPRETPNVPWDKVFELRTIRVLPIPASEMQIHGLLPIPDLDGDLAPDILITGDMRDGESGPGAPGFVAAYSMGTGRRLWVTRGTTSMDDSQTERLGTSAVVIGDINEDFVPDVCAGAPGSPWGEGRIAFLSGKDGTVLATINASDVHVGGAVEGWRFTGFGSRLVLGGDVDHDGIRDLLVGECFNRIGMIIAFSTKNRAMIRTFKGCLIGGLGDLDGDEVRDVLGLLSGTDAPQMSVVSGASGKQIRELASFHDIVQAARAATVGDLDHDGIEDMAVEMPWPGKTWKYATSGPERIAVYSPKTGNAILDFTVDAGRGVSTVEVIRGVGDLDGDGVPDIGVDIRRMDAMFGADSWIAIHSGKDGSLLTRFVNPDKYASLGFCGVGDTDGNGRNEVAIGSGGTPAPIPSEAFDEMLRQGRVAPPVPTSGQISIFEIPTGR